MMPEASKIELISKPDYSGNSRSSRISLIYILGFQPSYVFFLDSNATISTWHETST